MTTIQLTKMSLINTGIFNKSTKKNTSLSDCQGNMITFRGNIKLENQPLDIYKQRKQILNDEISCIFKKDRALISENFVDIVSENNKFSKVGYYLYLKEKNINDSELYNYLKSLNFRQLVKQYQEVYNDLKSVVAVKNNKYHYINKETNTEINTISAEEYIEKKLDIFFINKMHQNNYNKKTYEKVNIDPEFVESKLNNFKFIFKENPLSINKENIQNIFKLINYQLEIVNKDEYDYIYENINNLAEALEVNDNELIMKSWKNISDSVTDFYKNNILRTIVKDRNEKVLKLKEFLNSKNYQIINLGNKLSSLFEYEGSGELTLSEKVFLIDKYNQAEKDKKSFGLDMLDFLSTGPANNKIRKQIVKNLMESQEFAQDNFNDLKTIVIENITNKNYDAEIFNKKINSQNIIDIVLSDMGIQSDDLSKKSKIDYLSQIAPEDIEKILEKSRHQWIEDKFIETLNFESNKYDVSKQTDYLISYLTVKHNGKDIPINEFLEITVNTIYGQNTDLMTVSKKILEYDKANNKNIKDLFTQDKAQYDAIMSQMSSLMETLLKNNENTEAYLMKISKKLDNLEMNCPWLKPQVRDTRDLLQKIKDGVLNPRTLTSSGFAINALLGISKTLTDSNEPTFMTLGVIIMFLCHAYNSLNSFNDSYNRKGL